MEMGMGREQEAATEMKLQQYDVNNFEQQKQPKTTNKATTHKNNNNTNNCMGSGDRERWRGGG